MKRARHKVSAPTQAQGEILFWLAHRWPKRDIKLIDDIRGGDLIEFYEARWKAEDEREGRVHVPFSVGTGKVHAWRRSGGLQLRRLSEAGLLYRSDISRGVPTYGFTQEGLEWVESQ